jgi:hypothetical protein
MLIENRDRGTFHNILILYFLHFKLVVAAFLFQNKRTYNSETRVDRCVSDQI